MKKPVKVLHVGMTSNKGGLESYVMNLYRNIDREKVQFDFWSINGTKLAYSDEIKSLGGNIYDVQYKRRDIVKHYFKFPLFFFKNHKDIDVVHFHKTSLIDIEYIILTFFSKVPVRIVHSHSSGNMFKSGFFIRLVEKINTKYLDKFVTDKLACSKVSGDWFFKDSNYDIAKNSIDTSKFKFKECERIILREKFDIEEDTFVIGHIGYFTPVKNHEFILDIFEDYLKINPKAIIFLIGDGYLKGNIEKIAREKRISDNIIFTGIIDNVNEYLSGMDAFILPSEFEGFPISVIEAQCNGLPVLLSDRITEEVSMSNNCFLLSLDNKKEWVEKLNIIHKNLHLDRSQGFKCIEKNGYDIQQEAERMENYYIDLAREKGHRK